MMSTAFSIEPLSSVGCCGVGRPCRTSCTPPLRSRPSFVGLLAMTMPETMIRPKTKSRTKRLRRLLPIPLSTLRGEDDQQSPIVVIGREDVGNRLRRKIALGIDRDPLSQRAHAPLQRGGNRVGAVVSVAFARFVAAALGAPFEAEDLLYRAANHILVGKSSQLEAATPGIDHPRLLVADEEGGVRRRVVVVQQLEDKAEAALGAALGARAEARGSLRADLPVAAVGANEERHPNGRLLRVRPNVPRARLAAAETARYCVLSRSNSARLFDLFASLFRLFRRSPVAHGGTSDRTLEQTVRSFGHRQAEVLIGPRSDHAAPWSALEKALLKQIRLEHVFDRVGLLADRDGKGREANRPAGELARADGEQGAVAAVEPAGSDLEHRQRRVGDGGVDHPLLLDLGEVPHPLEQSVGDAWRAARALGNRLRPLTIDLDAEDAGRAHDDLGEVPWSVMLEPVREPEAIAQRRRQQAGAGGGADQGEGRQRQGYRAGTGALAEDDRQLTVLHRRIERLLDRPPEPVNLIDEEDAARLQRGEEGGDVGLALKRRASGLHQGHAHLLGDDVGE